MKPELAVAARRRLGVLMALTMKTDRGAPVRLDAPYQKRIAALVEPYATAPRRGRRLVLLAPPSHLKSTICTQGLPAAIIGNNPTHRIGMLSSKASIAAAFSMSVRQIVSTPAYQAIYPGVVPDPELKWTQSEWTVKRNAPGLKDPTLYALGTYGAITGRRFDTLIADDICDFENTRTKAQREKLADWWQATVEDRVVADGDVLVLGNRWHDRDHYIWLVERGYRLVQFAASPEAPLWPEVWSGEKLAAMRAASPAVFAARYMQDPRELTEGLHIKASMLRYLPDDYVPRGEIGIAVDCAMTEADESAFTAITVGEIVRCREDGLVRDELRPFDLVREHLSWAQQIDTMVELIDRYRPYAVGIERPAGGRQLQARLMELRPGNYVEIVPIKDPVTRAGRLIEKFQRGEVALGAKYREHAEEIVGFPHAPQKDIGDSLGILARLDLDPGDEHGGREASYGSYLRDDDEATIVRRTLPDGRRVKFDLAWNPLDHGGRTRPPVDGDEFECEPVGSYL